MFEATEPHNRFAHPNFVRRRMKLIPVTFAPVYKVFKPQKMIRMTRTTTGWVNNDIRTRKRWSLAGGKEYAMDEDKAREFCIKGYAVPVGWELVASEDEVADVRSVITVISHGSS